MAIYHLTHRTVGRSTHAAGTAGAHLDYITRASACRAVIAQHIPAVRPGSRGSKARDWMDAAEAADRKNARVIDKLEVALPLELDEEERVTLVRRFVRELSGGADVPFFAAFHDKAGTKDESNPHAHVVVRDRDPQTGKGRVIGMSEQGSTDRARETWERVCNDALARAGSTARIDRRSLKAQGIDRAPQGHQGPLAREIDAKGKPSDKLARIRAAPGHDPALNAPERKQRAREAARQEREVREARRAADREREARHQREAEEAARTGAEARQRAAAAHAEAEALEVARLAQAGRALIEQDRRRVMLSERHRIAEIGLEWAALEQPPRPGDLDIAARWVAKGHGKRLDESPWMPPKPVWVAEFRDALVAAWRWIASLIERNAPAADQAASRWAAFHEQEPAVMAEWRELVEQDAQAALRAGHGYPDPGSQQGRPKASGTGNGFAP